MWPAEDQQCDEEPDPQPWRDCKVMSLNFIVSILLPRDLMIIVVMKALKVEINRMQSQQIAFTQSPSLQEQQSQYCEQLFDFYSHESAQFISAIN